MALHETLKEWLHDTELPKHRRRMRDRGYRPVQIGVPDVPSDAFAAEAHRQSAHLAAADRAGDDQDFVEAISVNLSDWE